MLNTNTGNKESQDTVIKTGGQEGDQMSIV